MTDPFPRCVSRFADLPSLYAAITASPEFQRAFGDPMPLSITEPGEEPGEHDMPEPLAAQAECGAVIATIFDLLTGTRLEPLAAEIAWGFVNSFHFVAGKLERREEALADEIRELARHPDSSEVYNRELEDKQLLCQSTAEQRGRWNACAIMLPRCIVPSQAGHGHPRRAHAHRRLRPPRRSPFRIFCADANSKGESATCPKARSLSPRAMPNGTTGERYGPGSMPSMRVSPI
jgi:hypothetical protein